MPHQAAAQPVQRNSTLKQHHSQFKSFGSVGPPYQVGDPVRQLGDGDRLVHVTLVQTGERVESRLSSIAADQEAK